MSVSDIKVDGKAMNRKSIMAMDEWDRDELLVRLADLVAEASHQGQKRKFSGEDYIVHPRSVADRVSGDKLKQVALLHDVLEDTSTTAQDLYDLGFSKEVIAAVTALSRKDDQSYFDFVTKQVAKDSLAMVVKIADLKDNMKDLKSGSMRDKYEFALHFLNLRLLSHNLAQSEH